jgi:hypothetical protein
MPGHQDGPRGRRTTRRFPPWGWQDGLEPRTLLSGGAHVAAAIAARAAHQAGHGTAASRRITPTAEINAEYAAFGADFAKVEHAYLSSLTSQSTSTSTVTATLAASYAAGSVQMPVDNASVFGPNGAFASPVVATASVGGVSVGTFSLAGRSGNVLLVDTAQSSAVNLNAGVVLSASVSISASSSAAAIFPSFINTRSQQMAINLVVYFNNFPIKLPAFNAPPHTPTQRGAIQSFVYQQVTGGSPSSLVGALQAIPLPTTTSADVTIYNQAVLAAIEQSRQRVLSGVNLIFSGRLKVAAPQPANRLGISFAGSAGGTSATGSASGSSTGTSTPAGSTTPGTGT